MLRFGQNTNKQESEKEERAWRLKRLVAYVGGPGTTLVKVPSLTSRKKLDASTSRARSTKPISGNSTN